MHKSQVLFFILISFIAGIFTASLVGFSLEVVFVLLIAGIGILAISAYHKVNNRKGILAGVFVLFFIVGAGRFSYFEISNSILLEFADRRAGDKGIPITLRGYIDNEPKIGAQTTQFNFRVRNIIFPDKTLELNEKTRVVVTGTVYKSAGDVLEIFGAVSTPQNFDEEFDYINYLKKDAIRTAVLFPEINEIEDMEIGFLENATLFLKKKIFAVKRGFESAVNKTVAEPNASYINGILLGSRQNIPEDLKEAFNKTGTTHLLAISGYNIMIIASSLLAALVFFVRRRTAFWISLFVILVFTVMTGGSASVVRAAIMGLVLLFAQSYGRMYEARNSIVLAGAAMIYLNPYVLVFDIGFQLSFLAVLGLLYLYPVLKRKLKMVPEAMGFKEAFLATFSAQSFVFVPLLFYFGQFSWVTLPVNVLVLPFTPFAMLFGFLTGVSGSLFEPLGQLFGFVAWAITEYQLGVIRLFS